ncbi:hypothetical protein GCM10027443_18000 [Pontibacter brevis]
MIYDLDSDMYELDVPKNLRVVTKDGVYDVVVESVIKDNLFDCVTSFEDYDYVMEQYVKKQMHIFSPSIRVLVLFYDEELALHATMPVRVSINGISEGVSVADVSYRVNRLVMSFQEWQLKS